MSRDIGDTLLIATHNSGKLAEFQAILAPRGIRCLSNADFDLPEPEETENSFVGNARIKAMAAQKVTGLAVLADDSGIEIDGLGGAPGVHTADWAETPNGRDFTVAMTRAWTELEGANAPEPRTARFRATLFFLSANGQEMAFEGAIEGRIVWPMRGEIGHGYDPVFQPDGEDRTFAEMDAATKNAISHRARAVKKFTDWLDAEG